MKAKLTLFSSAKQGFAVCDVVYEKKGRFYDFQEIKDRATGLLLNVTSVLHWHSEGNLREQIDGIPEFVGSDKKSQATEESLKEGPFTTSVIPEDCPKKLRRFYTDDTTPVFSNLGWD